MLWFWLLSSTHISKLFRTCISHIFVTTIYNTCLSNWNTPSFSPHLFAFVIFLPIELINLTCRHNSLLFKTWHKSTSWWLNAIACNLIRDLLISFSSFNASSNAVTCVVHSTLGALMIWKTILPPRKCWYSISCVHKIKKKKIGTQYPGSPVIKIFDKIFAKCFSDKFSAGLVFFCFESFFLSFFLSYFFLFLFLWDG